jgi:O-antigen ligase
MIPLQSFLSDSSKVNPVAGLGCMCICIACFFTPLSTSLMGIFSALAVVCWIVSGHFISIGNYLVRYPATSVSLLFFFFMCLAISWSPAGIIESLITLKKYRELFLLPVFVSMLSLSQRYRTLAEYSFITGCIALMIISYGIAFGVIPEDRYGHSIVFHITHSFFMAVLSFWSLHYSFCSNKYRWVWLAVFILSIINIFYIAPGRTGMVVVSCLMILFMFQRLSSRNCLIGIVLFCSAVTAIYYTSDNFAGRVDEVVFEIKNYEPGKARTSIGQRFDWYRSGIQLIREKPILGHGTGSYPYVQERVTINSKIKKTDNPHNEYLLITIQFGLVGLLLFFSLIAAQIFFSRQIPVKKQMLLHGVILAITSGSLINSLLFDSQQGHFYLFMSAALMTAQSSDHSL